MITACDYTTFEADITLAIIYYHNYYCHQTSNYCYKVLGCLQMKQKLRL